MLKSYINDIFITNSEKCNISQVLDSLDITVSSVPTINLYLFELIQNALDAGANTIKIEIVTNKNDNMNEILIFQHNGHDGFGKTDKHIRGMSNVFQSTKSVGSVGFMGFGFKTLYKRFTQVHVSDINGWSFLFKVDENVVHLNNQKDDSDFETIVLRSRSWLGAVCPIWDETIEFPEEGFTTRFLMKDIVTSTRSISLEDDVNQALFSGGSTALAVLSTQGLRKLIISTPNIPNRLWDLDLINESSTVVVKSDAGENYWRLFEEKFYPDIAATQALCQARLKNILQNYDNVENIISQIRKEYRVLGLVPLNNEGEPINCVGQLFATLPIESFLPFSMSIQADWLLDLSRKGLRDVLTNPWQHAILRSVAKLIASYLESIPKFWGHSRKMCRAAFSTLQVTNGVNRNLVQLSSLESTTWQNEIKEKLKNSKFIPIISESSLQSNKISWETPTNIILMPETTYVPPNMSHLIQGHALDSDVVGNGIDFLLDVQLVRNLNSEDLIEYWCSKGLENWWNSLPASLDERRMALVKLWAFLAEFEKKIKSSSIRQISKDLKCIPNYDGNWASPSDMIVFENEGKYIELPDLKSNEHAQEAMSFIENYLPQKTSLFPQGWVSFIVSQSGDWKGPGRIAFDWISQYWNKKPFIEVSKQAFKNTEITKHKLKSVIGFTAWAASLGYYQIITHVVTNPNELLNKNGSSYKISDITSSVIGAPFAEKKLALAQSLIFEDCEVIAKEYSEIKFSNDNGWLEVFEKSGAKGKACLEEKISEKIPISSSYNESKKRISEILEVNVELLKDFQTTSKQGWTLVDTKFKGIKPLEDRNQVLEYLAPWLEASIENLVSGKGTLIAQGYIWRKYIAYGRLGTANWTKTLNILAWVPQSESDELLKPSQVHPQKCMLSMRLLELLESKGVLFGRSNLDRQLFDSISLKIDKTNVDQFVASLNQATKIDYSQKSFLNQALKLTEFFSSSSDSVKLSDLVFCKQNQPNKVLLTLGGFLTPTCDLEPRIFESLQILFEKRLVCIPHWPTPAQALRYLQFISNQNNSSHRDTEIFSYVWDRIMCDQELACSLNPIQFYFPTKDGNWIKFEDLKNQNDHHIIPINYLGNTVEIQNFVFENILKF